MSSAAESNEQSDNRKAALASALIALVYVAIVLALLAFDDTETEGLRGIDVFSAYNHIFLLSGAGLMAVFSPQLWLKRKRVAAAAGPLLLRVTRPRWQWWKRIGFAVWGLIWVTSLVLLFIGPFSVADLGKMAAYTIVFATLLILDRFGLSQSVLEFRERGLLYKLLFWTWENLKDHTWTDGGSTLRLKVYGYGVVQFGLDPSKKDEVDTLLEAHRGVYQIGDDSATETRTVSSH
jgi:hypothetical protein